MTEKYILATTLTGGNREDYDINHCSLWLVERDLIDKNDFTKCEDGDELYPYEKGFLDELRQKGYSITRIDAVGYLRVDRD